MKAKLLTVGKGGVHTCEDGNTTCSGYVGHNWRKDVDESTVCIDSRHCDLAAHAKLAISGPMCGVDLPPGMVSKPFDDSLVPYDGANARSLDYVSLDVYVALYRAIGAHIHTGAAAVAFAETISGPAR